VRHLLKKEKGQAKLSADDQEYDRKISKKRIRVENHFADLNQFQILHHAYRGNILHHANALLCCEVFLSWTWK
jgi:IS5 family transposase